RSLVHRPPTPPPPYPPSLHDALPISEIRYLFTRHGGNLGAANSVAWMFDRKAQIVVDAGQADEDATLEVALEAGAEDVARDGDQDRKSTRLNSSHGSISYAVFCLKKK